MIPTEQAFGYSGKDEQKKTQNTHKQQKHCLGGSDQVWCRLQA